MSKLEAGLQNKILKWLRDNRVWHFRYSASATFGIPDILCLYKGVFIGLEVKRPDGKGVATGLQQKTLEAINNNGGRAILVESMEEVHALFKEIDNKESG